MANSRDAKTLLLEARMELGDVERRIHELQGLTARRERLLGRIEALEQVVDGTAATSRSRDAIERRTRQTVATLGRLGEPTAFNVLLRAVQAEHGSHWTKNHLTTVLKDPRIENVAAEGERGRYAVAERAQESSGSE